MWEKPVGNLKRNISNIPGWKTNRKIVIIESDDWGSIRMPSHKVYVQLIKLGIRVDCCPYNRYDSLENEEDLSALFEVLVKFKDKNGNYPVLTANTVVANPDFEKIKASGFTSYFYEPFTETLKRYNIESTFELWKTGMRENIFYPQFHGREHVNVPLWLRLLKENNNVFLKSFDFGLWGLGPEILKINSKIHIQASLDSSDTEFVLKQPEIIREGLLLFENLFKFKAKSFIANNFIWDKSLDNALCAGGIKYIQGMKYQISPILNREKRKLIFHYSGERNKLGQTYLVRNCNFDPSETPKSDNVSNCLHQIKNAFFWKKPAIISSHRLNFIGSIDPNNRRENLKLFESLIDQIIKKWPDVEFLTSDKLGEIIDKD
jgi:hypothetical protein